MYIPCVGDLIRTAAHAYPQKEAVVFYHENGQRSSITYQQLNSKSNSLANALTNMGIKKNDHVALYMLNSIEYTVIFLALAKIGAPAVPVDFSLVPDELSYIINHSDSKAIFFDDVLKDKVSMARKSFEQVKHYIYVGDTCENSLGYEEVLSDAPDKEPEVDIRYLDCLYIGYTSGTTGRPKGAVISHYARSIGAGIKNAQYMVDETAKWFSPGPMYHAKPLVNFVQAIAARATLISMKRFNHEGALRIINNEKVTHSFMVPAMFNMILSIPQEVRKGYDVSSVKVLVSAAAPLLTETKLKILDFFKNAGLHEFYGATELALCTNLRPEDQIRKVRCVGLPSPIDEVKILDDDGNEVPRGEVGILYSKNPTQFDGYYKNPKATEDAFRDGFNTAQDMARMDEEGYIYIVDRKKDMILHGGENVYPAEIEESLKNNPKIFDLAVIGVPNEKYGEEVKAVVVLKENETASVEEIIDWCQGRMSRKKIPRSVDFVDELPRNPSGKILKRVLRDQYLGKKLIN